MFFPSSFFLSTEKEEEEEEEEEEDFLRGNRLKQGVQTSN
jgi:hypothetical protein